MVSPGSASGAARAGSSCRMRNCAATCCRRRTARSSCLKPLQGWPKRLYRRRAARRRWRSWRPRPDPCVIRPAALSFGAGAASAGRNRHVNRGERMNNATPDGRIPVTIITGFLGSGKTTLVNTILNQRHGRTVAVIVNEFGEIGIDGQLIFGDDDEQLIEFNNGCLCCTVRGDLIETLGRIQERMGRLDAILIETTGLADPAPVASTFFVAPEVRASTRLDAFVTVVDAVNFERNLEQNTEAREQVGFADIVLLNKTDLACADQLTRVQRLIGQLNPLAKVYH